MHFLGGETHITRNICCPGGGTHIPRDLDQNHALTRLEKSQLFDFLNLLFYRLETRFLALQYHKKHFPGHYFLIKKMKKWPIFGPKPWTNPFGKISIFRLFKLFCFISKKGVFSLKNIIKTHFSGQYCLKMQKGPIFDQNHGLTPMKKSEFFDFLNMFF